jgi:hypothetical protein
LKAGDTLRYRGIEVGRVEQVTLKANLEAITVKVRLSPEAQDLARTGSEFWIVRPELDLSGVRGLDTLVGANYLAVQPGQGSSRYQFVGLEQPPLFTAEEAGGLEIVLVTPGKSNLLPGAPLSYRQVEIGQILTVDLARDASAVEARARIAPRYLTLIRENTRFWKTGGARLNAGLTGFSLAVDSVQSLIQGGVTMAIPPDPGPPVAPAYRFPLHDEPQKEWLTWVPYLSLQETTARERYYPLPATLRWRHRTFYYLARPAERLGRVLPVTGGLLGPADLLVPPENALPDSVSLILEDGAEVRSFPVKVYANGLARLTYPHEYPVWPAARQRVVTTPEDTLIIADPSIPSRFVGSARYAGQGTTWTIDPAIPFDGSWHGACVIAESDGALLGLVLVTEEQVVVASFSDPSGEEPAP